MAESQLEAKDLESGVHVSLEQASNTWMMKAPRIFARKMPRSIYENKDTPYRVKSIFESPTFQPQSQEVKWEDLCKSAQNKKEKRRSLKRKSKSSSLPKESPKYVQRKWKLVRKDGKYGHLCKRNLIIPVDDNNYEVAKTKQEESNKAKAKRSRKSNANPDWESTQTSRVRKMPKHKQICKQK